MARNLYQEYLDSIRSCDGDTSLHAQMGRVATPRLPVIPEYGIVCFDSAFEQPFLPHIYPFLEWAAGDNNQIAVISQIIRGPSAQKAARSYGKILIKRCQSAGFKAGQFMERIYGFEEFAQMVDGQKAGMLFSLHSPGRLGFGVIKQHDLSSQDTLAFLVEKTYLKTQAPEAGIDGYHR